MIGNRKAWNIAAQKYVDESPRLLDQAEAAPSLTDMELSILRPLLQPSPLVVHLQSGHGLDDLDLVRSGAASVVGIDFSLVTAKAAQARAIELDLPVRYAVSDVVHMGLRDKCADLVYTGKGALMWLPDIGAWAREVARLLRPGGYLFVYEAHPVSCLWTTDAEATHVRSDRSYFGGTRINDTFPASAIDRYSTSDGIDAVEWQWTLADVVNATLSAGLEVQQLGEYPEPFWRPPGVEAAAWSGSLPNSFSLLARRPGRADLG